MKNAILLFYFLTISFLTFSQKDKRYHFTDSIIKEGIIFKCPYILTEIGGKRLLGSSEDSIKIISNFLKKHSDWVFEISNHTDERGNAESNKKLSENYALFIAEVLINDYSIPREQLIIKGYGGTMPLISLKQILLAKTKKEKEALHSRNRRYELKAIKKR